jgi:hypothetical protein
MGGRGIDNALRSYVDRCGSSCLGAEPTRRPADIVEHFVRLIEAGAIESAIGLLSDRIVDCVGMQKLYSIFHESSLEVWSLGGIEIVDVQTLAFSRDHVEMRLSIWYGDHKVENETVELVRESRQWKISMGEVRDDGEG